MHDKNFLNECYLIYGYKNAKLKLLKLLSGKRMRFAIVLSFFQHLTLDTWSLMILSAKCDEILRFRWICFNLPQGFMRIPRSLDLVWGIGIHTAKMFAWGLGS